MVGRGNRFYLQYVDHNALMMMTTSPTTMVMMMPLMNLMLRRRWYWRAVITMMAITRTIDEEVRGWYQNI